MKNYLLKTIIIFSMCIMGLNAQEKEKVHVKIIKEVNGETTVIDTIIERDSGELFYYCDKDHHSTNLDSMLKVLKCDGHKDLKFITITDDGKESSIDSEHIFIKSIKNLKDDSLNLTKIIVLSDDDVHKKGNCKTKVVVIDSDSKIIETKGDTHAYVYLSDDGEKITINKTGLKDAKILKMKLDGLDTLKTKNGVYFYTSDDDTFSFIEKDCDKDFMISEIKINKTGDDTKVMEIFITEGEEDSDEKLKELEEVLKGKKENVKIERYKTEDGKIVIKAEFADEKKNDKSKKSKKDKKGKKK